MLTTCPACGQQVSPRAAACPHCGDPIGVRPQRVRTADDSFATRNRGFGDILLYAPVVILLWLLLRYLFL